jgi:hypothetical protein
VANQTGVSLTFADMAEAAPNTAKYVKGGLTLIEGKYDLSDVIKFTNLGGQQHATVPRPNPDTAGGVFYRNVDGQYTWTKSSLESFTEDTAELTYAFKLDSVTQDDPSYSLFKPGPTNMSILAEQWSAELLDMMFNGSPEVVYQTGPQGDPLRRIAGLKYRLQNGLNGIDTSCYQSSSFWGGSAWDLTNIGSAIANNAIDGISEMISLINPDFIAMNYRMRTLLMRSQRVGNMLKTTADTYNRKLADWDGIRVITPQLKSSARQARNVADTSNWILPYEDVNALATPTAGAGSQYGSIYFVRTNPVDGFTGFTVSGMKQRGPEKLPLPDEAIGYAMRMGIGFGTLGIRCIGAIKGIKIG